MSTGSISFSLSRAKERRFLVMSAILSPSVTILSKSSACRESFSLSSRSNCAKLIIPVIGLLTSWATPAASSPIAASWAVRKESAFHIS
jgi:hypothetical protein